MNKQLEALNRIARAARQTVNDTEKLDCLLCEIGFAKRETAIAKLCNVRTKKIQFLANTLGDNVDGANPIDCGSVDHVSVVAGYDRHNGVLRQ